MEIIAVALTPEIIEVEDDSTDSKSEDEDPALSFKEAPDICEKFGKLVIAHSDAHGVDSLLSQRQARHLCTHLCHLELAAQTQATLTDMWGPLQSSMDLDS